MKPAIVSVLLACVLVFYANFLIYNTSPVALDGSLPLLTVIQNVPLVSAISATLLYICAFYLLLTLDTLKDTRVFGYVLLVLVGIVTVSEIAVQSSAWILTRPVGGFTDEYVLQYFSAIALLHGTNPYTVNFTQDITSMVPLYYRTILPNGSIVHNMDYPAFAFLYYLPAATLGVSGIYQDVVVILLFLTFAVWKSPIDYKWFIPMVFILDYTCSVFIAGSITDAAWVVMVCLAVFTIKNPRLSAILMGLAISYKEEAIVILPFYLILIYKTYGISLLKVRMFWIGATALAINLPFFLLAPKVFIQDILIPITAPLEVGGVGLSLFDLPKEFYTFLFVVSLVLGFVAYYKWFPELRIGGFVAFPMIALWLNARSLQSYMVYFPVIAAVAVMVLMNTDLLEPLTKEQTP